MFIASEIQEDKLNAIEKSEELVMEYKQTRKKIKKQLAHHEHKPSGSGTARVDQKLIEKLYTIIDKIEKL